MNKRSAYINTGLFVISILLIGLLIYWQISDETLLVSETIAMFLFSISIVFKRYNLVKAQYFLFVLLLILLFQTIHFTYTVTNDNTTTAYEESHSVGINPIILIILIAFLVVNRKLRRNFLYGSDKEKKESFEKDVSFYYNKFNEISTDDLKDIFNMYKEYPKEAQVALLQIQRERELNYIENV